MEEESSASASSVNTPITPQQEEILALCNKYTSEEGMSFVNAMNKAIHEVIKSKDTLLEYELRRLGCVQWGEIAVITQEILDTVKVFHNPARGNFILKPGLLIVYISENLGARRVEW